MHIDPRLVSIFILDENDLQRLDQFDCGDQEMNRFLQNECFNEQEHGLNKTYVLYYRGDLAAFCSICADKISLAQSERDEAELPRNSVPAVKIARIGRENQFRELTLGRYLIEYIQYQTLQLAEEKLGIRFITLDAYPTRVPFYESLGFVRNVQQDARRGTVSMRLDIYSNIAIPGSTEVTA